MEEFLAKAGIKPPSREPPLTQPIPPNFLRNKKDPTHDYEQARDLLLAHRKLSWLKKPDSFLDRKPSLLRLRDGFEHITRTVTKRDVAKSLGVILQERLPPPWLAQAIVSHAPGVSIDELWRLQRESLPRVQGPRPGSVSWLILAVEHDNVDYIHLLCDTGISQEARDEALAIALSKCPVRLLEMLLRYGANVPACKDVIRQRVHAGDVQLARLLLSVPNAMSTDDWQFCDLGRAKNAPALLPMCLIHHPNLASTRMLLEALDAGAIVTVAIILGLRGSDETFRISSLEACRRAHLIRDQDKRSQALLLLAQAGWIRDTSFLRTELLRAIELRQISVVKALVDAGVFLDIEPSNALVYALERMDVPVLELFRHGSSDSSFASVTRYLPTLSSEEAALQLLRIFGPVLTNAGDLLSQALVHAVKVQHGQVVRRLLYIGATVAFDSAASVRTAIRNEDLPMLLLLLDAECSSLVLSEAMSTVVTLRKGSMRNEFMTNLLTRRAPAAVLRTILLKVISLDGEPDLVLIRLLLHWKAPIDGIGEQSDECMCVAARRCDLELLRMLCAAKPSMNSLDAAVRAAYDAMNTCGRPNTLSKILILMKAGAAGPSVNLTLLDSVRHECSLGLVSMLLNGGADANDSNGESFAVAIVDSRKGLFKMLCRACPPSLRTLKIVLPRIICLPRYDEAILEEFLQSASSVKSTSPKDKAVVLNESLKDVPLGKHPNAESLISSLLKHGLDVNLDDGRLFRFVVPTGKRNLLDSMLSALPNVNTLRVAFSTAIYLTSDNDTGAAFPYTTDRLWTMGRLLEHAKSSQIEDIGQSAYLAQETHKSIVANDFAGLRLLLHYDADVNAEGGRAVRIAAIAGCVDALDLLLEFSPSWPSIIKAILDLAASHFTRSISKEAIFKRLLAVNTTKSIEDLSALLAASLGRLPGYSALPRLLIAQGAQPGPDLIISSFGKCSMDLSVAMLSNIQDNETARKLFKHFTQTPLSVSLSGRIYEALLSKGIPRNEIHNAMLDHLRADRIDNLEALQVLLEHGADVGASEGAAFRLSLLTTCSVEAFLLLAHHVTDSATARIAFEIARKANLKKSRNRFEVYRCLLEWEIEKAALSAALIISPEELESDISVLRLLLSKGADPNKNSARCFVLARDANSQTVFRALSEHADLDCVLRALMVHSESEAEVVRWFCICLEERPLGARLVQDDLLFECLSKFPMANALPKLMIQHGLNPSVRFLHSIAEGCEKEECTLLIWALSCVPRIETDCILALLACAKEAVVPAYTTPATGISAAFLCLFEKSRTPILEALLHLDPDLVSFSEVEGPVFARLATSSNVSEGTLAEFDPSYNVRSAAFALGNFEAFRLVAQNLPSDDDLHMAALLALPRFVKFLLRTHDANYESDMYDRMIPLAMACTTKAAICCKIANEEADFKRRQKETMKLLKLHTNLKWRHRKKTVLHIALDNGVEATESLLTVLELNTDKRQRANYQWMYTDKDSRVYSPQEYVEEFSTCPPSDKEALIRHLGKNGF